MNTFLVTNLFVSIIKIHKKVFIITGIAAIVVGLITAFMLPVEYRSETIILPARHFSVSKLIIEPNVGNQPDYLEIGDDDDLEKLLQIIYSDDLKILLANKLNLWKRWKLENEKYKLHYLKNKWEHYINIHRTNYGSIRIKVYDKDPDTSAIIANKLVELIDTVQKNMSKDRIQVALTIVMNEYNNTIQRIKEMEDSLNTLRTLGIYDYKEQVKAFSKQYAKAIAKNDRQQKAQLESFFNILQKYGGAFNTWSENLRKYRAKFAVIKNKYDQMIIDANNVLPLKYVIQKAYPDNKKVKPVRWFIILISFISAELVVFAYYLFQFKSQHYEQ